MKRAPLGFTLLELLVAITVLSMVSLISWRGLDSLVMTRERLEPEVDEVRALLTVFGQMERDLAQIAQPAFLGLQAAPLAARVVDGTTLLELARIAPTSAARATEVQSVYYRVVDGVLVRQATPSMNHFGAVDSASFQTARLLTNVESMQLRLWRPGAGWLSPGETPGSDDAPPGMMPPRPADVAPGVEVTLTRANGKIYRRVFLVGA